MSPSQFNFVGRSNNLANLFREQTNNKSKANQKKPQPLLNFVTGSPDIIVCQAENTIERYQFFLFIVGSIDGAVEEFSFVSSSNN